MNDRCSPPVFFYFILFYFISFLFFFLSLIRYFQSFRESLVTSVRKVEPVAGTHVNRVRAIFLWYLLWLVISRRCTSSVTIHGRPIPKENPPSKLVGENSRNVARLPSNATLQRSSLLFLHERASERSETTKNQVLSYFLFIVTRTHVYTTKHARVYRSLSCCIFIYIVYLFESSKIPVANVTESYPKADTIANCGGAASMGQIGNDVSLLFVHFSIVFFFLHS